MTAPHEKLNRAVQVGADKAGAHLDALTRAYGRSLRAAGRRAAVAFRRTETVTAAADPKQPPGWVIPPTGSLIDAAELAADTQRKTAKIHRLMLAASAGTALEPFGISFEINAPLSQALLDAVAQRIQDGISAAIKEQITEAIQAGYSAGQSVAQVSSAIQAATDAISRPRADMLARTDLNALSNGGSLLAASVSGAAPYKQWTTAGDDKVRPDHEDADGQTVAINDTFTVGGESAQYPGDPQLDDAEAANCRCTIVYVNSLAGAASPAVASPRDFASWRDHEWEGAAIQEDNILPPSRPVIGDGGPDVSNLAMVAVYPAPEEAEAISLPAGKPPETMHVTLVFLGEADIFDSDAVREVLSDIAADSAPLSGVVGGVGRFAAGPDGAPLIALPDVKDLSALREAVAARLEARGITSPSVHGWTPHLTLDYAEDGAMPPTGCLGKPLTFSTLSLAIADVREDFPLTGQLAVKPSPGVLYLARHGLTAYDSDDHASDMIRGWADDPLNDAGVAEAKRLAANLRGLGITTIEASDLQRAEATASAIVDELQVAAFPTEALRPWNLGDFQGRTSDDAREEISSYADQPDVPVPGGESFNDFCSRFLPAVADAMAAAENGATPLLVTHSHNLKLARAWIRNGRQPVTGDQFMAEAPGPASVLACDPSDSWSVKEILCDGDPLAPTGMVPPEVHYRPSDEQHRECGTCDFFADGRCSMFDADVLADYVCDEFVARHPASAVTSGGTMSDLLLDTAFGATGDTGLPLSERDRAWDAGEATGRVKKWASSDGSGDPDKIDYGKLSRGYFWQDKPGDGGAKIGDLKLPFGDIIGGKLTAVWRGVTAGAQRLSQTQGIDADAVQKKMGAYYSKAAKQFGDDTIKPPWASGNASADGEALAIIRAQLADQGADGVLGDDELRAVILAVQAATTLAPSKHRYAGSGGDCKICGNAASNKEYHYAAEPVTLDLSDFALLAATTDGTPWQATLCVADEPTVDSGIKRLLIADGGSWRPLPLPLALLDDSPHADMTSKAPICGRIDQIWWAGNVCQASGVFFDASDDAKVAEAGSKAAALVSEMRRLGISVDLVDCEVELCAWNGSTVTSLDDANDPTASEMADPNAPGGPATEGNLPNDIPDMDDVEEVPEEIEYIMAFSQWVIAGATICPVQALTDATISLVAGGWKSEGRFAWVTEDAFPEPVLTAAAAGIAPLEPPAEWFKEPSKDLLADSGSLTITDDGRVYGWVAKWGVCHTGKPGRCITAPHSPTSYRNFHRGQVKAEGGERIDVGVLTMNTGHAGLRLSATSAAAHYDDTGAQGAHIRVGENDDGIWLAGAINPKLSAEDARLMMASSVSGDWREVNRGEGLDLFAALAVNGPGFPVPRARIVASGADLEIEPVALVAAGRIDDVCESCQDDEFSWRPWRRAKEPASAA